MQAIASTDQVFVGLSQLGFEIQYVGAHGAASVEAFASDAQAFLDAIDRFRLDVGKSFSLQDAMEAASDFMDQLIAGGSKSVRAGLGPVAGHVFPGVALAVEQAPLGAKAQAQIFGVAGMVGVEPGIHHVQLPLIQFHHECLDGIVAGGVPCRNSNRGIVVGLGLAQHRLGGADATFSRLQGGGVVQRRLHRFVQGDGVHCWSR